MEAILSITKTAQYTERGQVTVYSKTMKVSFYEKTLYENIFELAAGQQN